MGALWPSRLKDSPARIPHAFAASLAAAAGAELQVKAVIDDRVVALVGSALHGAVNATWRDVLYGEMEKLRGQAVTAAEGLGADAEIEVVCGRPSSELIALSEQVDLLIVGSRRWGATARVLLGSVGEALMQNAACPLITVPGKQAR